MVIGTVAGAASAWRDWHPVKALVAALALFLVAALTQDLGIRFDFESVLGAVLVGPLVGFLPTAAGFVVGRQFVLRMTRASGM